MSQNMLWKLWAGAYLHILLGNTFVYQVDNKKTAYELERFADFSHSCLKAYRMAIDKIGRLRLDVA